MIDLSQFPPACRTLGPKMAMDSFQISIKSPEINPVHHLLTVKSTTTVDRLKLLLSKFLHLHARSSFFLTYGGKPLRNSATVSDYGIAPFSTVILHLRAVGGGGDGGATGAESRDCYLNMYAVKKPDKVDPNEKRLSKWTTCALSFEPLKHPCVLDWLGNIFNKEALVEALLGRKLPKEFGYIKGLKDMIPIHLSPVPGTDKDFSSETRFQCPITGLEFNGKHKFVALRNCGHVLSFKALKEVGCSTCLVCHQDFEEDGRIVINGGEEEVELLRKRMEDRKAVPRKKNGRSKNSVVSDAASCAADVGSSRLVRNKVGGGDGGDKASNCGGGMKLLDDFPVKRFKAAVVAPPNANKEVYASIFTSSKKTDFKETYSCRSLPLGRN